MTNLAEQQFEILPDADGDSGLVFGPGALVDVASFDPGETTWLTQDTQNTRRGNTGFGRDVVSGRTWTWESFINQVDAKSATETLEDLAAAWAPEAVALTPGALVGLRYRIAGRDRRVFGRPRRLAAPPTVAVEGGMVPVTHDFATVDNFTYDDIESSVDMLPTASASGGGLVFPLTFPTALLGSATSPDTQIQVGGRARAYPRIRFHGPWINPSIETDNWSLRWSGGIPAGGWIEIDARPWILTVLNQSGGSAVDGLDRRTWLEDIWFPPQSSPQVRLGGTASPGAHTLLRWRNTWNSL